MPCRACWLAAFLAVGLPPCSATEAPADPVRGWAVNVRGRLVNAVAKLRRKLPKGALVKLSFTVNEAGKLEAVRGEGDPRAVAQVLAAVRGVGLVPAPPDHKAHAVTVPIKVQ